MQTYIQTYFFLKGGNLDKGRWLCEDEGRDWGDVPTSPGIRQIASKPLKARRGMNRFPQKKAKLLTPWSWASSLPPELGGNIFLLFKPPILCYFVTAALANELEKAVAPHFSTLAWKILWTEEPGRLQRVGHDWAISLSLSCTGEGNGNPLQCSCLENPRDGGAWWAAVCGVAQSRTWLKWLSSSSSSKWIHRFFSIQLLSCGTMFSRVIHVVACVGVSFLWWSNHIFFYFFGHAMWHVRSWFPSQALNPSPLHWKCGVLTTGLPAKSPNHILLYGFYLSIHQLMGYGFHLLLWKMLLWTFLYMF